MLDSRDPLAIEMRGFPVKKRKFIPIVFLVFILFFPQKTLASTKMNGLVVENSQVKIIENQKLIIEGDIIIKPNGTLIIKNSDITLNSHYKNQYWILINSGGLFLVENSILREGSVPNLAQVGKFGRIENFRLGETVIQPRGNNATVILRNSTSELRIGPDGESTVILESSYLSILFWRSLPSVNTKVINSSIQIMHIWLHGDRKERIQLSNLQPGKNQNLHLFIENATLHIENSQILRYSLALWSAYPLNNCRKDVTIQNSQLSEIFAVFPKGSNIKLWNIKPRFFENWDIHQNMEGKGVPWNLKLKNVYVNKWKLDFHGIAEVDNSVFHLDTWDRANVTVENSIIVSNHHTRGGYIKLVNSVISDRPEYFTGVRFLYQPITEIYNPLYIYELENSTLGPYAELSISDDRIHVILKGDFSIKIPPEKVHWFGGTITREFKVIVLDRNNKPLSNQTLVLLASNGEEIWRKDTNRNGLLYFNLTFNKENYKEAFLLQVVNNSKISRKVSFFTDTPIILSKVEGKTANAINIVSSSICFVVLVVIILYVAHRKLKR
ncbi:hypothetical protein CW705_04780 [Candidatus Bathyarchaeota archaeon]|nr:MAG: hypothetical protein CW705_04780 [Candidatus Bathyarchaeota archaeon]